MEEIASGFAANVLALTVKPIVRQFHYLIFHGGYVRELKDELKKLQGQRDSLQHQVNEARRNVEEIEGIVQDWFHSVHEITETAEKFYEEETQARTECSMRSCPNPWSRYWLSKKAKKITEQVIKLERERNIFKRISYRKAPAPPWVMASSTSFSRGNEAFDSRVSTMNMIMDALTDPTINKIGLHGLAGVGKTTMAREVADKALRERLFDSVVVVEVTQNPDYKKIQRDIGEMLGLKFDEESESARAGRLCERLKQEKNVLVILDDLWERLDLGKIGIPSAVDYEGNKMGINSSDDYKGCKIMLISRSKEVLSNQMNCKKYIMLGVLSEEEAWQLFKEMAEVQVDSDPDLSSVGTDVAKECAGLPIAIVTAAKALRNKGLPEWRNALRQLQNPTRRDVTGWTKKEIYTPIKLSYDNLEPEELKSIFLLSSMLYNEVFTPDLFKYCLGLGIIEGIDHSIEAAEDSLHTMIDKLKSSSLFLDSSSSHRFTMHDIVRNVALSILADENYTLAVRYKKLDEWPEKDKSDNYKWICAHQSDIGKLPEKLSCPKLEFFYLNNKDHDMNIPDDFFKELCGLRVMDLTRVNMPLLPNSILHLKNLRTLCLDFCVLGDISMIGELKNLRALSLIGSIIQQLPCELGELTQLQLIDLTNCSNLKIIPPNVISKLKRLEEIYMEGSFNQWQYEGSNHESSANANLSELMDLPNLSTLHIHIPHASMMRKGMFPDRLKKYRIIIGDVWEWSDKNESSRTLKLKLNTNIYSEVFGVKKLMDGIEHLFLDEVNGIQSVLSDFNGAGFPRLRHLQIQNNSQIQCIIQSRQVHSYDAFPNLETLVLENMIQLDKLCHGKLPGNSFSKLRVIRVRNGDKLKNLFPVSIVRSLPKLDEIEISSCKLMQEIVDLSDQEIDDEGTVDFHQLRILRMSSLPALVGFCFDDKRSLATTLWKKKQFESASSSSTITKEDKPDPLEHLFSNKVAFPNLESLKLSTMNFRNIWHDSISASSWLQNLTDLSIEDCGSIRYIMPTALARCFVKLKHLNICRCDMVEMIIFPNTETSNASSEEVIFPSLETMAISHMNNLQIIWHNQFAPNSFAKFKKVEISYCGKLITIIPSHMLRTLSQLETLKVSHCGSLDTIFDLQSVDIGEGLEVGNCKSVEAVFDLQDMDERQTWSHLRLKTINLLHLPKLRTVWNKDPQQIGFCQHLQLVKASECESLRSIFPASIAKDLPKLEVLDIRFCSGIEVIVERDEVNGAAPCFLFPQLYLLTLLNLPNLKNFYPERHTSEWPFLRISGVCFCPNLELWGSDLLCGTETHEKQGLEARHPLFLVEKGFPNLEELILNQKAVMMIRNGQFQTDLFHKAKLLGLDSLGDQLVTFPYSFLEWFPNLTELHVFLGSFEEIFPCQGVNGNQRETNTLLKVLSLRHLHKLKNIWHSDSQLKQVLQNLESLKIECCTELINLAPSSASFDSLTNLDVSGCHQLIYLVTCSVAKSLVHLTTLKVNDCKRIEEIIANEEEIEQKKISFKELECLKLKGLPSLKSFCSQDYKFKFPSLNKVIVQGCPKMKMFCGGVLATPSLEGVKIGDNVKHLEEDLNRTIQQLYSEKVAFRGMEKIKLDEYPELIDIWEGKFPNWSFSNLKSLKVENCDFLPHAIPSYLLYSLSSLDELEVGNCNSVEAVFDLQDIEEPRTLPQLKLKSMMLWCLPKLKYVWNKDPQQIDFCQHLQEVEAFQCESLRSIFPASIAKHLPKLEALNIHCCSGIEVIVERDEVNGAAPCFVFPQVSSLRLWNLPNLKNFYPERHTSEWPRLRDLIVYMCKNVEVFGSEVLSAGEAHEKDELAAPHPLFIVEKVVPNLEELVLNQKLVMMIRNGQFQTDLFHKVKLLYLESFGDQPVTFPHSFLEGFPNLTELHVVYSSFEEIFPCQGVNGNHIETNTLLKVLSLHHLHKLKNIWHSDSQVKHVLQNLESLEVECCPKLINLAPSPASFDSLTNLDLSHCRQLTYLVTSSTAESLVHLIVLKVKDCQMIEEIIADGGENEKNEISLKALECLELTGLPSLKSFCSQDYKFKFPSLDHVTVSGCLNMKIFCSGEVAAPLLDGVKVEENKIYLEGDLNKIIEQLFWKKDRQSSLEG